MLQRKPSNEVGFEPPLFARFRKWTYVRANSGRANNKVPVIEDSYPLSGQKRERCPKLGVIAKMDGGVGVTSVMAINRPAQQAPAVCAMEWGRRGYVFRKMAVVNGMTRLGVLK
jgi:hypothetical protein